MDRSIKKTTVNLEMDLDLRHRLRHMDKNFLRIFKINFSYIFIGLFLTFSLVPVSNAEPKSNSFIDSFSHLESESGDEIVDLDSDGFKNAVLEYRTVFVYFNLDDNRNDASIIKALELVAQLLSCKNVLVAKVTDKQLADSLEVKESGSFCAYHNGSPFLFYGYPVPDVIVHFILKIKESLVKEIHNKETKIAFDKVEVPTFVGYFEEENGDYSVFEEAALSYLPYVQFYATFDETVAQHLRLTAPGTYRYRRPLQHRSFPVDEPLRAVVEVHEVVETYKLGPLVKFSLRDIYHPWKRNDTGSEFLAFMDLLSPKGRTFHKILTAFMREELEKTESQFRVTWVDPTEYTTMIPVWENMYDINLQEPHFVHFTDSETRLLDMLRLMEFESKFAKRSVLGKWMRNEEDPYTPEEPEPEEAGEDEDEEEENVKEEENEENNKESEVESEIGENQEDVTDGNNAKNSSIETSEELDTEPDEISEMEKTEKTEGEEDNPKEDVKAVVEDEEEKDAEEKENDRENQETEESEEELKEDVDEFVNVPVEDVEDDWMDYFDRLEEMELSKDTEKKKDKVRENIDEKIKDKNTEKKNIDVDIEKKNTGEDEKEKVKEKKAKDVEKKNKHKYKNKKYEDKRKEKDIEEKVKYTEQKSTEENINIEIKSKQKKSRDAKKLKEQHKEKDTKKRKEIKSEKHKKDVKEKKVKRENGKNNSNVKEKKEKHKENAKDVAKPVEVDGKGPEIVELNTESPEENQTTKNEAQKAEEKIPVTGDNGDETGKEEKEKKAGEELRNEEDLKEENGKETDEDFTDEEKYEETDDDDNESEMEDDDEDDDDENEDRKKKKDKNENKMYRNENYPSYDGDLDVLSESFENGNKDEWNEYFDELENKKSEKVKKEKKQVKNIKEKKTKEPKIEIPQYKDESYNDYGVDLDVIMDSFEETGSKDEWTTYFDALEEEENKRLEEKIKKKKKGKRSGGGSSFFAEALPMQDHKIDMKEFLERVRQKRKERKSKGEKDSLRDYIKENILDKRENFQDKNEHKTEENKRIKTNGEKADEVRENVLKIKEDVLNSDDDVKKKKGKTEESEENIEKDKREDAENDKQMKTDQIDKVEEAEESTDDVKNVEKNTGSGAEEISAENLQEKLLTLLRSLESLLQHKEFMADGSKTENKVENDHEENPEEDKNTKHVKAKSGSNSEGINRLKSEENTASKDTLNIFPSDIDFSDPESILNTIKHTTNVANKIMHNFADTLTDHLLPRRGAEAGGGQGGGGDREREEEEEDPWEHREEKEETLRELCSKGRLSEADCNQVTHGRSMEHVHNFQNRLPRVPRFRPSPPDVAINAQPVSPESTQPEAQEQVIGNGESCSLENGESCSSDSKMQPDTTEKFKNADSKKHITVDFRKETTTEVGQKQNLQSPELDLNEEKFYYKFEDWNTPASTPEDFPMNDVTIKRKSKMKRSNLGGAIVVTEVEHAQEEEEEDDEGEKEIKVKKNKTNCGCKMNLKQFKISKQFKKNKDKFYGEEEEENLRKRKDNRHDISMCNC